jgi:hypothetical protein
MNLDNIIERATDFGTFRSRNDEIDREFNDGNRKRRKGNGKNNKIDKQECIFGQRNKG